MRLRYHVLVLPMMAASAVLYAGCNADNEEGIDKTVAPGESRQYKSYGEYALEKSEQIKKEAAAKAATKGKAAAPPKAAETPAKP